MDLKEIKRLIQLVESSQISSFAVEEDNLKIEIKKEALPSYAPPQTQTSIPTALPVHVPAPSLTPEPQQDTSPSVSDPNLVPIKSPMVGTFYSAPDPESPPYVKTGDTISKGDIVCILEAMKLFNEIESDLAGTVERILVEPGAPIEYGQDLFMIRVNG